MTTNDGPVLGKVVATDGVDDVILKMNFKATNHPVQMYNYVYFSSKALAMQGCDPGDADSMGIVLNEIFQHYQGVRAAFIRSEPEVITDHEMDELIRAYCNELDSHPLVLDYRVTLFYQGKKTKDSISMGLYKQGGVYGDML